MDERTKKLRAEARLIQPAVQIGKNGVTDGTIVFISHELEQRHLVKVKLLSAALPLSTEAHSAREQKRALAADIAARTKSKVIDQVGNVLVFYRG